MISILIYFRFGVKKILFVYYNSILETVLNESNLKGNYIVCPSIVYANKNSLLSVIYTKKIFFDNILDKDIITDELIKLKLSM